MIRGGEGDSVERKFLKDLYESLRRSQQWDYLEQEKGVLKGVSRVLLRWGRGPYLKEEVLKDLEDVLKPKPPPPPAEKPRPAPHPQPEADDHAGDASKC